MKSLNIGIIGVGNMGYFHAKSLYENKIPNAKLFAVCDIDSFVLSRISEEFNDVEIYDDYKKMLVNPKIDAVIIATPHYLHPPIAIFAFENGKNVLTEKPAGVYTKQVRDMNEAAQKSGKKFAIMFNQRTNPLFKKAREIVNNGDIGSIKRAVWIITNWYRTQHYYDSGTWRGSYGGEGGGVLLNQCPHNLDVLQWILGMPNSVTANICVGKHHNISVEDEANLFLEYEKGYTATFLTSTGEPVGTNRLEISGSKGKIVLENAKLKCWQLENDEREFCFTEKQNFFVPKTDYFEIEEEKSSEEAHNLVVQNFVESILSDVPLIANGYEGINELTISNGAYLSAWKHCKIDLPFDDDEYKAQLKKRSNDYDKSVKKPKKINETDTNRWQVRW